MLKQNLQQKLFQKISPLQIQTIKLLELPLVQLEQRIKKELEENPILEENDMNSIDEQPADIVDNNEGELSLADYMNDDDTPNYKTMINNNSREEHKEYSTMSNSEGLQQLLEEQLAFQDLDDRKRTLGAFIIGSIDNDGYIRRNLLSITVYFE
jgi:RNA polymerase sigma-54 factor